jgi:hypothetical protein
MLNNQIIITDGNVCPRALRDEKGAVDANELSSAEWTQLRARNVNSPKARLVKCAKCWELYREVQWMKTYNLGSTRVVSHQPGESRPNHAYEPLETDEHRAFNERAFMIGDEDPRRRALDRHPHDRLRAPALTVQQHRQVQRP